MSETTSTIVYNEKLQSASPDWVPLARGPFEFRNVIEGDGVVRPGTPDEVLCESIIHSQLKIGDTKIDIVRSARLNRISGMIELTFNGTNPNSQRVLYPPAVEDLYEQILLLKPHFHYGLQLLKCYTLLCETWSRMEQEFRFAVRCGACIVFGRRGAYDAARFTQIPADIFLAHTNVDWGRNECTGPDGMKLFSVHCAGTERVATSREPEASPSKRCESWLTNQMRQTPLERPKPKSEFRAEAQQLFGISGNEFDSIWAVSIEKTRANWSKAGAPKKGTKARK